MAYNDVSDQPLPASVKLLVAGGFGVGKTTFIGSVSEIEPLTTEEVITEASIGIDDLDGLAGKTTTTVAFDFGRITLSPELVLYLFGTPGQDRFGFMWDSLVNGALGALVVADSARLDDCYQSVDYFERSGLPFAVAVNTFDGNLTHDLTEVRWALAVNDRVPVIAFDARRRSSVADSLLVVLEQALNKVQRS